MKNTIQSMTGYANLEYSNLIIEIKGYNSKFLDLNFKYSNEFSSLEFEFKELFKKKLQRGRVDVLIYLKKTNKIKDIYKEILDVKSELTKYKLDFSDEFIYQNLVEQNLFNISKVEMKTSLIKALEIFINARNKEGIELAKILLYKIKILKGYVNNFKKLNSTHIKSSKNKLKGLADSEILTYIQRHDITEELDRLNLHIGEFNSGLKKTGNGKKLEFLSQEILRELNTIASKNNCLKIAKFIVDSKVIIEQIREQVLNIE